MERERDVEEREVERERDVEEREVERERDVEEREVERSGRDFDVRRESVMHAWFERNSKKLIP